MYNINKINEEIKENKEKYISILDMINEKCPNGVEFRKIEDVAEVGTGNSNRKDAIENGKYPFYVRSKTVMSKNEYEFDEEAILIPGEGGIGEIFHYVNGKYALHQRTYRIHFTNKKIDTKFMKYYMEACFKDFIEKYAVSGTVKSIRKPMIENFKIPLPPMEIQQKIVKILDQFEELEKELEKELKMRMDQYEYYRNTLLSFDDSVEKKKLGDTSIFNFRYGQGNTIPKDKGIFPVYGCNGIVAHTTKYNCENTCVIGHIGSAGVVNWIEGKAFVTYNGTICEIVDDNKVNQKYLYYFLTSIDLKQYVKGNQPFLSVSDFSHVKIPLPSIESKKP